MLHKRILQWCGNSIKKREVEGVGLNSDIAAVLLTWAWISAPVHLCRCLVRWMEFSSSCLFIKHPDLKSSGDYKCFTTLAFCTSSTHKSAHTHSVWSTFMTASSMHHKLWLFPHDKPCKRKPPLRKLAASCTTSRWPNTHLRPICRSVRLSKAERVSRHNSVSRRPGAAQNPSVHTGRAQTELWEERQLGGAPGLALLFIYTPVKRPFWFISHC